MQSPILCRCRDGQGLIANRCPLFGGAVRGRACITRIVSTTLNLRTPVLTAFFVTNSVVQIPAVRRRIANLIHFDALRIRVAIGRFVAGKLLSCQIFVRECPNLPTVAFLCLAAADCCRCGLGSTTQPLKDGDIQQKRHRYHREKYWHGYAH